MSDPAERASHRHTVLAVLLVSVALSWLVRYEPYSFLTRDASFYATATRDETAGFCKDPDLPWVRLRELPIEARWDERGTQKREQAGTNEHGSLRRLFQEFEQAIRPEDSSQKVTATAARA